MERVSYIATINYAFFDIPSADNPQYHRHTDSAKPRQNSLTAIFYPHRLIFILLSTMSG